MLKIGVAERKTSTGKTRLLYGDKPNWYSGNVVSKNAIF
jgi:hypothetical protein